MAFWGMDDAFAGLQTNAHTALPTIYSVRLCPHPTRPPPNDDTQVYDSPLYSTFNPFGFTQNCVSVAIARVLAYRNVNELWFNTLGYPLRDEQLSHRQLVECVARAGWECSFKIFTEYPGKTAYKSLKDDWRAKDYQVVAYKRRDGTGHCVVRGLDGTSEFVCYQRITEGEDVSLEVQDATTLYVYDLRCSEEMFPSWWDRRISMGLANGLDPQRAFEQANKEGRRVKNNTKFRHSNNYNYTRGGPKQARQAKRDSRSTDPQSVRSPGNMTSPKKQSSMTTKSGRVEMVVQYMPRREALVRFSKKPKEYRQGRVDQLFGMPRLSTKRAT
ncbi:hypothetical protein F4805DRAFT_405357 [Annulohypoxylon moriforme]|nr:hypothetical protein F4805DRAFT_405357 [Annulohypoxylon moriforme]